MPTFSKVGDGEGKYNLEDSITLYLWMEWWVDKWANVYVCIDVSCMDWWMEMCT